MAWDEGCLVSAGRLGAPVLRFYRWSEPSATFGRFQKWSDVAGMTAVRPLIRRPTGGGIVLHKDEWTYSLLFPRDSEWFGLRAKDSYRRLHRWLQETFDRLGLATRLARRSEPGEAGRCFAGAEVHDLVYRDEKLAGAAQRRTREGLLIQGSTRIPGGITRARWEAAMLAAAAQSWKIRWSRFDPADAALRRRVESLAAKYASREYNRRR